MNDSAFRAANEFETAMRAIQDMAKGDSEYRCMELQRGEMLDLLDILLNSAQGLRIQQSQLLAESNWNKALYGRLADKRWRDFNKAHRRLWEIIQGPISPSE